MRWAVLAFAMALAGAASAQDRRDDPFRDPPRDGRQRPRYANPSAVISADLMLSRRAREKGEGQALREAAAPRAAMFVPQRVEAGQWLKRGFAGAAATNWQPHAVWMSCDGGIGVSRGTWRQGSTAGEYVAIWQGQENGEWRWLLREPVPAAPLGEAPEMIAGKVAECTGLPARPRGFVPPPVDAAADASRDGSLEWAVRLEPRCGRTVTVKAWNGRTMETVTEIRRPARANDCG